MNQLDGGQWLFKLGTDNDALLQSPLLVGTGDIPAVA